MPDDASAARRWALLRTMLRMRRFEEAVFRLSSERAFAGHFHIYIGQEATGAAIIAALDARDRLATTHRNHGHVIARGADPAAALAEILGRAGGLNGGRSGTLHLSDPSLGFISTSAVVGGCISLAVGAGYACKQNGDGSIAAAFFGDGALEEGVSYEAMNIASLFRLPVLFVCENNSGDAWGVARGGYPTSVHAGTDFLQLPRSLGIEALRVDGTDTDEIGAAANAAIAKCRSGHGPVFIDASPEDGPAAIRCGPSLSPATRICAWRRAKSRSKASMPIGTAITIRSCGSRARLPNTAPMRSPAFTVTTTRSAGNSTRPRLGRWRVLSRKRRAPSPTFLELHPTDRPPMSKKQYEKPANAT